MDMNTTTKMAPALPPNIEIQPLRITDLRDVHLLAEAAFHVNNRLLYTGKLSPSSISNLVASREKSFTEKHTTAFKVVDSSAFPPTSVSSTPNGAGEAKVEDKGRIIGWAQWAVYETDQVVDKSVHEIVGARLDLDIPELRKEVAEPSWRMIQEGKRQILGVSPADRGHGKGVTLRRRVELEGICVHPDYQRKGIARELLKWGTDEADRLGLDLYLEATEEGRPVYERAGFEAIKEERFECEFGAAPFTVSLCCGTGIGLTCTVYDTTGTKTVN